MGDVRKAASFGQCIRCFGIIPSVFVLLPLADFWLDFGPPQLPAAPILTSLVVFATMFLVFRFTAARHRIRRKVPLALALVISGASAAGYILVSSAFVAERFYAGELERIALGFTLKPEVKEEIQADIRRETARLEKERNPTAGIDSPDLYTVRTAAGDPLSLSLAKTDEEIRDEVIAEVTNAAQNPSAVYTLWSRAVMILALLVLWELTFAGMGLSIALIRGS